LASRKHYRAWTVEQERLSTTAQASAPVKAALTAQFAVAIAILTFAPIRLDNLVSIGLGDNLIKPSGPNSPYWLTFPYHGVKNRIDLEFPFDEALTGLIDEYIHDYRPTLLRGANGAWLFPGAAGAPKTSNMFSAQITERIQRATDLRITVHQFHHEFPHNVKAGPGAPSPKRADGRAACHVLHSAKEFLCAGNLAQPRSDKGLLVDYIGCVGDERGAPQRAQSR
jgi:integrase